MKSNKHIELDKTIFFTRAGHIDPEPRLIKAVSWLKKRYTSLKIEALGWDRTGKSKPEEVLYDIKIRRFYAKGEYGQGLKKNLLGLICFNLYLIWSFLTKRVDIIHAADLDTAIPAIFIKKIKNAKVVYDIYDFYSETHSLGKLSNLVKKIEMWVIRQADVVIIADEKRIEQLPEVDENIKNKISVIYNTPDQNVVVNETSKYLLGYVGILAPDRGLLETINAFKSASDEYFIIAGYGKLENEISKISVRNKNIIFRGKVSYEEAIKIENSCRIILALYDPNIPNNRYAAPNKLCEALMLGKPIITSRGTNFADIIEREKIGYVVEYGNVEELKKLIVSIQSNPRELEEMGKRAKLLYNTKYSAKIMQERIQRIYDTLMS